MKSLLNSNCGAFVLIYVAVFALGSKANADTLYSQPPLNSGTLLISSYWDPDGSDFDELAWDGFLLPVAGNITEIRWRGGGSVVSDFEISIWASIPAGIQPDVVNGRLFHRMTGGNAGQTYAGTFGGTAMYDYHYVLPQPFLAAGNTRYWVQIIAWTPGWPSWGFSTASGGNGTHFARVIGAGDYRYIYRTGDTAFTLIGTNANCSIPTITLNPTTVIGCYGSTNAVFTCAASGTGTFTYRWRKNGNPMYDGPNGGNSFIMGATTASLTITNPSGGDNGIYDCGVANSCGPAYTAGAQLVVTSGGPNIPAGPAPISACSGETVSLTVIATNGPLSYVWERNGAAVADGVTSWGSIVSGATTGTMTIENVQPDDAGSYLCVVTNPCSSASSDAAQVTVTNCCAADFDGDGFVTGVDFDLYVLAFESGGTGADFDQDGFITGVDFDLYVVAFEAGC